MNYIVLPAFNEEQNIRPLFEGLEQLNEALGGVMHPILVDDGSTDATVEKAKSCGEPLHVRIIQHEQNKGLGAAVLTGLKAVCAEAADDDIVVLLDADNTHTPEHIMGMLKLIRKGNDIVIASRYAHGGKEIGLSPFRSLGSRGISLMLSAVFHATNARDYTCGFRAYRVGTIKKGFEVYGDELVSETSFVCMAELLVKLFSVGARIEEYPLVLRYDLKQGASKMNIVKTLKRYVHLVLTQAYSINQTRAQHRVRI
jgi:dolichol-phosphate mannosyltransferase